VDVRFQDGSDPGSQRFALARLIDYHSQSPPYARDALEAVNFEPTRERVSANFTASNRSMTIFGSNQLNEGNFNHEMGHAVASKASGLAGVPEGWQEAVRRDGREVSGYGKEFSEKMGSTLTGKLMSWLTPGVDRAEDFAEAYSGYLKARESGPEALAEFRRLFPERARVLDGFM
jgi:hypothetical protein